jgi:hypothetical protein
MAVDSLDPIFMSAFFAAIDSAKTPPFRGHTEIESVKSRQNSCVLQHFGCSDLTQPGIASIIGWFCTISSRLDV